MLCIHHQYIQRRLRFWAQVEGRAPCDQCVACGFLFLSQGPGKNSACMTLPKAAEWNPLELHLSREVCVFSLLLKVLSWIWGSPEATRWRGIAHIAGRTWNYVPGLLRAAHKPLALKTRIDCCLAHVLLEEVPENRGPFRSLKAGVWVCVGTKNLSEGV